MISVTIRHQERQEQRSVISQDLPESEDGASEEGQVEGRSGRERGRRSGTLARDGRVYGVSAPSLLEADSGDLCHSFATQQPNQQVQSSQGVPGHPLGSVRMSTGLSFPVRSMPSCGFCHHLQDPVPSRSPRTSCSRHGHPGSWWCAVTAEPPAVLQSRRVSMHTLRLLKW